MRSFWKKSLEASLKLRPIHRPTHPKTDPPTHPLTSVCSRSPAKKPCSRSLSVWERNEFHWHHHHFHHHFHHHNLHYDLHHDLHYDQHHHLNVTILMWLFTSCKNCCLEKKGRPGDMLATVLKKGWLKVLIQNISLDFWSLIWKLCQQICL